MSNESANGHILRRPGSQDDWRKKIIDILRENGIIDANFSGSFGGNIHRGNLTELSTTKKHL